MTIEDKDKKKNYYKKGVREIYSKTLEAGNRRYYFDTNETNAGDYFLSITESKKLFLNDGKFIFKKHKIFLYKEDFKDFKKILNDMIKFIFEKKGEKVISNKTNIIKNKKFIIEKDKKEIIKDKERKKKKIKKEINNKK
ncbi:MAG: PUR family DNA/RNA-binding protein [Candidatus Shikimatogenerans bostrichidophilus]|nr:MAG: PUR family DNA/RNA-binding protein [Candidatus Shikimatogenerans bostrichidophilus]